jgi:putative redox protein
MESTLSWQGDVKFLATSGSGHQVLMDGAPNAGGENAGSRPMELILMGLSGCASFDVVGILKKAKQDVTAVDVELSANRADETPAVFTDIHLRFIVTGRNIKPALVERAVKLSAEKYCSASIMLARSGVNISHEIVIREPVT